MIAVTREQLVTLHHARRLTLAQIAAELGTTTYYVKQAMVSRKVRVYGGNHGNSTALRIDDTFAEPIIDCLDCPWPTEGQGCWANCPNNETGRER